MAGGICLFCLWLNNFLLTSIACIAMGVVQIFSQKPTTGTLNPFPHRNKGFPVLPGKELLSDL